MVSLLSLVTTGIDLSYLMLLIKDRTLKQSFTNFFFALFCHIILSYFAASCTLRKIYQSNILGWSAYQRWINSSYCVNNFYSLGNVQRQKQNQTLSSYIAQFCLKKSIFRLSLQGWFLPLLGIIVNIFQS